MKPDSTWRDLPGHTIYHPLGCETPAWFLNVVSVTNPNADGMVTISAVEGEITVCHDMNWFSLWRSPQMVDFEESLLMEELHLIYRTGAAE